MRQGAVRQFMGDHRLNRRQGAHGDHEVCTSRVHKDAATGREVPALRVIARDVLIISVFAVGNEQHAFFFVAETGDPAQHLADPGARGADVVGRGAHDHIFHR